MSNKETSWLDLFPPSRRAVREKEGAPQTPASRGRSIWRRGEHQDTLDLHGLKFDEARREITRFITSMRRRGLRKGLIIHGKGLHSPEGSVLKPLVREYLESSGEIGEFGRAKPKNGGSGATWFLLRHRAR